MYTLAFEFFALSLDHEVKTDTLDQLEYDVRLAFLRQAVLIGAHDVRVLQRHAHCAFRGALLLEAYEALLKLGGLDQIEHLDADDFAGHAVTCPPDFGHAPLAGAADQLETLFEIDDRQVALGPALEQ